jgi:hypothetical protein
MERGIREDGANRGQFGSSNKHLLSSASLFSLLFCFYFVLFAARGQIWWALLLPLPLASLVLFRGIS